MLPASLSAVIAGLVLVVWGADRFVLGASATARRLGVSPLIVGMVIVGFATSTPEMLVAVFAALQGNAPLGVGNAVGSNITNIALILGAAAIIWPLLSTSTILRRELPLLIAVSLLAVALLLDRSLGRFEGLVLLLALAAATGFLLREALREGRRDTADPLGAGLAAAATPAPLGRAIFWLCVGCVVLLAGSRMLVWGGVNIAQALGISDLIIGLTIIAVGTSLPELASALASAARGEHDLVLGNVIGSNIFNTLAVLGLPALIAPFAIPAEVLTRDLPVMAVLTILLLLMLLRRPGTPSRINRLEGMLLLSCFAGYYGWLFFTL